MADKLEVQIVGSSNLSAVSGQAQKDLGGLNNAFKGLTGVTLGWTAAFGAVGGLVKSSISSTVAYAEEVRNLSRNLDINAEESSKLLQIADDLKIEQGTLTLAFKTALKQGISPNITNLKQLAKEYQTFDTPVEKAQFAMEKFGRAGLEMQKVLELAPEAIDDMARSAEMAGLIMDDEAAQAARDYEIALDNLEDTAAGLKVQLGNFLIPVLTEAANATNTLTTANKQVDMALEDHSAEVAISADTYEDYVAEMERANTAGDTWKNALVLGLAAISPNIAAVIKLKDKDVLLTEAEFEQARVVTDELDPAIDDNIATLDRHEAALRGTESATNDNIIAYGGMKDIAETLDGGLQTFTKNLAFTTAAQNLDAGAAFNLGLQMGVIDSKTVILNATLPALKQKYDENADGLIDAAEAASGYNRDVAQLIATLDNMPSEIDVKIKIETLGTIPDLSKLKGVSAVAQQFGGDWLVTEPTLFLAGERGPERATFQPIQNSYNLTIHSQARTEDVRGSFELMRALAR